MLYEFHINFREKIIYSPNYQEREPRPHYVFMLKDYFILILLSYDLY